MVDNKSGAGHHRRQRGEGRGGGRLHAAGHHQHHPAAVTSLLKKVPYDPVKDFTPIGKIATTPFVLIVNDKVPATDLKLHCLRQGKSGQGALWSRVRRARGCPAPLFASMIQGDMQMIPYKGIPPAITDMLGGNIEVVFADLGNAQAQIKGGKVKAFGVTSANARRVAGSAGDRGTGTGLRAGAMVRADGASQPAEDIAAKLTTTLQKVLASTDVKAKLHAGGFDIDSTDAAALARLIDSEVKRWGQLTKAAKIEAE